MTTAPRIETERLVLRGHAMADLDARIALTGDEGLMRFVGGVQGREENISRILRYAGHWALFGRGPFAVEEKAGGRLIGEIGIADFMRGLGEDFDGYPEGLWVIDRAGQGKGYAIEAMTAAIAWHERAFGAQRMVCIIAPENTASLRVAEKLGFRAYGERRYKDHPVRVLERSAETSDRAV